MFGCKILFHAKANFYSRLHHLYFFLSFFFRRCRETEVRICCHLDCVDVMFQIWYYLITNFHLKLMQFSARHNYLYAFSIVGLMKMKEVFST